MKKGIIATAIFGLVASLGAQSSTDTVTMGTGYANQIFFNLQDGKQHNSSIANWHIAHTTLAMDNAIRLNHAAGVFAYIYPNGDNGAYNSFDTTGWSTWHMPYNDMKDETKGALNQQTDPNNQWDFSWGVYDASSHEVVGDSLYLITVGMGAEMKLYKFMPIKQDKMGNFIFEFGPLDDVAGEPDTIKTSMAYGGMFKYFNFTEDKQVSIEPQNESWHLNFNRYYDLVQNPRGPGMVMYPTTGAESFRGLEIAHVDGIDFSELVSNPNDYISIAKEDTSIASGHGFNTGLTRVGGDWKAFDGRGFSVVPQKNYIAKIETSTGFEYWGFHFLSFEGQSTGAMNLERAKLGELASVTNAKLTTVGLFPNPASDMVWVSVNNGSLETVNVLSTSGQKVASHDNLQTNRFQLPIETLTSGQYIIETIHSNGISRNWIIKN